MSPQFQYIGSRGETIVGMQPVDLSAEEYDALDYDHQQAVYLNRGSDGAPLYVEVRDEPAADMAPTEDVTAEDELPAAIVVGDPASDDLISEPPAEPEPPESLDEPAPAEGAN